MAVLIRSMNMPQCCAECNLEDYLEGIGGHACPVVHENAFTSGVRDTSRLPHCPLKEVKEPKHGQKQRLVKSAIGMR